MTEEKINLDELAVETAKKLGAVDCSQNEFAAHIAAPGIILEALIKAFHNGQRRCAHNLAKEFSDSGDSNPDR